MINKLDTLSPGKLLAGSVRRIESGAADNRSTAAPVAVPSRASTSASTGKSLLERASERANHSPDVDLVRVDEIKTAIARGEFSIDAKAVARAFIHMESA